MFYAGCVATAMVYGLLNVNYWLLQQCYCSGMSRSRILTADLLLLIMVFCGVPGFQQQASKEMEFGTTTWTSRQCRKEKKPTPTSNSLSKH